MSTANVARDLDLLRRAVGDRALTYWGISYGSILGATYANLFPGKVRALALDGVADPVEWYTGRHGDGDDVPVFNRVGASRGTSDTLEQYFALCDAAGPGCALSDGSPRRRFKKLAAELKARPVILEEQGETFEVGYDELVSTTLDFLYFPDAWAQLAEMIRSAEDAVAARTTATATGAVLRMEALRAKLGPGAGATAAGAVPERGRSGSRRGLQRDRQPRPCRRLAPRRTQIRSPRPVLRPAVDVGNEHLRAMAGPRLRPLHRPVHRHAREPDPSRQSHVRPGHSIPGSAARWTA